MRVEVRAERWPIAGGFRIARGRRDTAEVVVVELESEGHVGRGECVPYARYGESCDSVRHAIEAALNGVEITRSHESIVASLPAGAARSAIDCALWELFAAMAGQPVWKRIGLAEAPGKVSTMRTISVDSPEAMARAATNFAEGTTLKVKVDGGPDLDRIAAVHEGAPSSDLVVDANESWSAAQFEHWVGELGRLGVVLLEQPLPAGEDVVLAGYRGEVALCADESVHDTRSLDGLADRYSVVNVKLDKAGGLTEAHALQEQAHSRGLKSMVGCMVSTSLAIAPALLLASQAAYVDLDGPLLLERDRTGAIHDASSNALWPSAAVWGG